MMKVLGLDSALTNTGWQLLAVNTENTDHSALKRLDGGTIKQEDTERPLLERLYSTVWKVFSIVQETKPELLVIEDAISVGDNKSPTGLAMITGILSNFHPLNPREHYKPSYVVLITPERLQSLAHKERKTTGTAVVKKYKELTNYQKRVTNHEADAFFLAYYGVRFYHTMLTKLWPEKILDAQERRIFKEAQKEIRVRKKDAQGKRMKGLHGTGEFESIAMIDRKGTSWWCIETDPPRDSK